MDDLVSSFDPFVKGREMHELIHELYPICRSITGNGVRKTLAILRRSLPIEIHEVPTGTEVFDWTVPKEWNVRDAYIKDPRGHRVVDFKDHNLHLLGYSVPLRETMPLEKLRPHLHSLPGQPDRIPYRTSYYKETWGFCLRHETLAGLEDGEYEVLIDTDLKAGSLTYGEFVIPGESDQEVLFSSHICHPSLCNDNLSGIAVNYFLARELSKIERHLTYRFLFIPGTIGSITWLALNRERVPRIGAGLVMANLGDRGQFHYKRSRQGNAAIDRAVVRALEEIGEEPKVEAFIPFGYDERQFCSPAFNLAVGSLTRTPWGRYPEYHTSGDDLELVRPEALGLSLKAYLAVVGILEREGLVQRPPTRNDPAAETWLPEARPGENREGDRRYRNLKPECEPQLGKRGLYRSIGGSDDSRERELALLWVLNYSDGDHSLGQIAERSGLPFDFIATAAHALEEAELLEELDG